MDYSGKLLYNTASIDAIAKLPPYTIYNPNDEMSNNWLEYGDGYVAVINISEYADEPPGICFYIEELTGSVINTDYTTIRGFHDGLAAVEKDGMWGYIDTSFNGVIETEYDYVYDFKDGKAIVWLAPGYAVIDRKGNILLETVKSLNYSGFFFAGNTTDPEAVIYDSNLKEVYRADGDDMLSTFNYGGSTAFSWAKDGVTTIVTTNSSKTVPGSYKVYEMNDMFLYCGTAEGDDIIIRSDGTPITKLEDNDSGFTYVSFINQDYIAVNYYIYDDDDDVTGSSYLVLDKDGSTIFSGTGTIDFNNKTGFFQISGDTYYAWVDTSGKYVFRISLLDCIPD
jgi:hypothetical protein